MKKISKPVKKPPVPKFVPAKKSKDAAPSAGNAQLNPYLKRLMQIRSDKAELKKEETELNTEAETTMAKAVEIMDALGISKVSLKGFGLFFRTDKDYISVPLDKKDALMAELKKRGLGALIQPEVSNARLKAQIEELKAKNLPPLLNVTVFTKPSVGIRSEGGARSTVD